MNRVHRLLAAIGMAMCFAVPTYGADMDIHKEAKVAAAETTTEGHEKTDKQELVAKDAARADKEKTVQEDKKKDSWMTNEAIQAMKIPHPVRLVANDFHIGTIRQGDSVEQVKKLFGSPTKYSQSSHYTTIEYKQDALNLRIVSRNEHTPNVKVRDGQNVAQIGAESIFLGQGETISLGRNIHLQVPTEVLIRQFGIPTNVLRDADANVYYMVYKQPHEDTVQVFAIANRKVQRVALMPARVPYYQEGTTQLQQGKLAERDFTLMGFSLGAQFQANKYNMWNNLIKRENNNFWLYGDYGVEVDRRNIVRKVFLLTNSAYTGRGTTLGYHVSTILGAYGRPNRVEIGPDEEKSVDAYYYDSAYQKGASLVFVINHKTHYVEDVILTDSPIKNLQDPMGRYDLK